MNNHTKRERDTVATAVLQYLYSATCYCFLKKRKEGHDGKGKVGGTVRKTHPRRSLKTTVQNTHIIVSSSNYDII